MSILTKIPVRNEEYSYRIIDDQIIIIDPLTNKIKLLNAVAATIWLSIDGKNSVNDILQIILDKFNVEPEKAELDLTKFLQELMNANLIKFEE
jgi:hypothetical protein